MNHPLALVAFVVVVIVAGLVLARSSRAIGRQIAVTWMTFVKSVNRTINHQVFRFGQLALAAIIAILVLLAITLFVPHAWVAGAMVVGGIVALIANICLGLSNGVGTNVVELLCKPDIRDHIDAQLDMIQRTRRHLQKYLSVLALALVGAFAPGTETKAADAVIVWAIDASDSVDPAQREAGVDALIAGALDTARELKADTIQIVKFSDQELLSDMAWLSVPPDVSRVDCDKAEPEPVISKSWVTFSPNVMLYRKQDAVAECLKQLEGERRAFEIRAQRFRESLRAVTRVNPRTDGTTRIVPLVQDLLGRPCVRGLFVLSDFIDHSAVPIAKIVVPRRLPVIAIVARPNPKRREPTLTQVLEAANAWRRLPGVLVTSVSELPGVIPGFKVR